MCGFFLMRKIDAVWIRTRGHRKRSHTIVNTLVASKGRNIYRDTFSKTDQLISSACICWVENHLQHKEHVSCIVRHVPTRDRGPGDISSEDFPSYARIGFVPNAIVLSLSHGEVPSHRPSAFPFIFQEFTRNASRKSGTPVTAKSPNVKCPMVRP